MITQSLILILFIYFHHSFSIKYDNYTLYRGIPVNEMHLSFYQNLSTVYDVSFWREPGMLNMPVDFMISPKDQPSFQKDVEDFGLYVTTILEDVQQAFDLQTVKSYIRRRTESFDWNNYFRLDDIYSWLRDLSKVYPKIMTVKSIGKTSENREIMSVMINLKGQKSNSSSKTRPTVIIEGGIHAREWISTAFVTHMINAILHAPFSDDAELKEIAHTYEWHFVPVLNPDGYEYTHTTDRMWRKNRNRYGVDLNRNFDYNFGNRGGSFVESYDTYCGAAASSEKETKAMSSFIKSHSNKLKFYFAFHAYGQFMIIPYADLKLHVENFDEVKLMAIDARKKLSRRYGTEYLVGTAYDTVGYRTSGTSGDWVKKTLGVEVVCTFELRDNGKYGFALPPRMILPTCQETMDAMISLLTPRRREWQNRLRIAAQSDCQMATILDTLLIVCNFILFITLCFS